MAHFLKILLCFFLISFLFPTFLFSRQRTYEHLQDINPPYIPWFTGALLPPSAVNAKPRHPILAVYGAFTLTYGAYDDRWDFQSTSNTWAINPFIEWLVGINQYLGIDVYASMISNYKEGKSATHLQDTTARLGLQIANDTSNTWIPDVRLTFQEVFPTGNYRQLDPDLLGIDATGQGSFQSGFNLITQKIFPVGEHFLVLKWSFAYLAPSSVRVKGINTYGGNPQTKGTVKPGQRFQGFLSGEYSISQRWVFTIDSFFEYQQRSKFSGNVGEGRALTGLSPKVKMTVAPEVEYNFSPTSGMLIGIWASIFGKNTPAFASGLLAFYYTF